jgi:hypothetical protein
MLLQIIIKRRQVFLNIFQFFIFTRARIAWRRLISASTTVSCYTAWMTSLVCRNLVSAEESALSLSRLSAVTPREWHHLTSAITWCQLMSQRLLIRDCQLLHRVNDITCRLPQLCVSWWVIRRTCRTFSSDFHVLMMPPIPYFIGLRL